MAREYFKDLPNTTTPLRAERINGLLNGEESIEKIVAGSIEGKNLFDIAYETKSFWGVTRVISNGKIILNGTPTGTDYNDRIFDFTAKRSGTYTLTPFKSSTNANIRLIYQVNNGSWVNDDTTPQITMNVGDELHVNLRISSTNAISNFILTPQLEIGSTATDYVPYMKYGYNSEESMGNIVVDDILPTNLIPFEAVTTTSNGVTFTVNADKTVKINGTATAQTDFTIGYVDLKANQQYYLSGANGASSTTWFLNIQGVGNDSGSGFIYTPSQNENKRIFIRVLNGVTVNNAICTPMLNKGSSANSFDNSESEVYSTNEIKIGRWTDGKPLYRKVIQFTSPSDNNFHEIATGSFDNIFIETFFLNIPVDNKIEKYLTLTNAYSLYSVDNSLRLKYLADSEFYKNRPMTVIIKYTKTTD